MNLRTKRVTTIPGSVFLCRLLSSFPGCSRARRGCARARSLTIAAVITGLLLASIPVALPNSAAATRERAHSNATRRTSARTSAYPDAVALPQATPTPSPQASPQTSSDLTEDAEIAGQKVKLYYFRQATKIVAVLTAIKGTNSQLKDLIMTNPTEDEIILYGSKVQRGNASRIIATLDLPQPGINMEMWGIQISSRKPKSMVKIMPAIRAEIDRTQQAVRETYGELQRLTRKEIPELDDSFDRILVKELGYKSALDAARPLSLQDILLRMIAARDAGPAAVRIANGLEDWLKKSKSDYVKALNAEKIKGASNERRVPFERFFEVRGLSHAGDSWVDDGTAKQNAIMGRKLVVDFAFNYGRLVHQPQSFSAYSLQQSADSLNSSLQAATDALNFDMQGLFVAPTLAKIQEIVRDFTDVEYAQVGKVSVASLSGVKTTLTASSVSAFDVTPPLRLSELLTKAKALTDQTTPFVPKPADNIVGAMPLAQVIGLVGALGEERSVWRELTSGISLTITPNVLRNMASAELDIALRIGDPLAGTSQQAAGVKPLSRVSKHEVDTTIYVNALDFFDLSAFASQSTLGGGRGFVPIIGPVWQGIFGPIPVVGKLFSWDKPPQTVFSESLVLTNSFITPTAMGIALLYPTELTDDNDQVITYTDKVYERQRAAVEKYKASIRPR